ncbi:MAG TPA: hypothetical protein G4O08_01990, partial [Anaerolineae bacterium]|nr:hypothetical protein [Anaerolineae bacterium]
PTRPPAATPTPALTVHIHDLHLKERKYEKDGDDWQAVVKIYVMDGEGDPVEHAEVIGNWNTNGDVLIASCTSKKNGDCDLKSGWIPPSESTTFTVTEIEYFPYMYTPADNEVPSWITVDYVPKYP